MAINKLCEYGHIKSLQWWYERRDKMEFKYDETTIKTLCSYKEEKAL